MSFAFAASSILILEALKDKRKNIFAIVVFLFGAYFTICDLPEKYSAKEQKQLLEKIAQAKESVVKLKTEEEIWHWNKIRIADDSKNPAMIMQYYGITDKLKLYEQE